MHCLYIHSWFVIIIVVVPLYSKRNLSQGIVFPKRTILFPLVLALIPEGAENQTIEGLQWSYVTGALLCIMPVAHTKSVSKKAN